MKKFLLIATCILIFIILFVISLRVFSKEDTWICNHGSWTKHGNPSESKPATNCNK